MNVWKKRAQYLEMLFAEFELNYLYIMDNYIKMFKLSENEINSIRLRSFKRAKNVYAKEIKLIKKSMRILNPFDKGDRNIKIDYQIRLAQQRKRQRLCHILYCIAKGRTLEQIELTAKHKLDLKKMKEIVDMFGLYRFDNIKKFLKTLEEE
jgi:16S rRNA G527 N7-methylase RsmG